MGACSTSLERADLAQGTRYGLTLDTYQVMALSRDEGIISAGAGAFVIGPADGKATCTAR